MSLRFKICLAAWIAVVAIATTQQSASGQELTPRPQLPADAPATEPTDEALAPVPVDALDAPVAADVDTELAPAPEEAAPLYGTQTFGDPQPLPESARPYDDGQPWVMEIRPSLRVRRPVVENPPLPPSDAGRHGRAKVADMLERQPQTTLAFTNRFHLIEPSTMQILLTVMILPWKS